MVDEARTESERRFRLSQETIAIVIATLAIAALILTSTTSLRTEMHELRDEARADRAAWQAEIRRLRDEARAERDADREHFQREILRLTASQAELAAIVKR